MLYHLSAVCRPHAHPQAATLAIFESTLDSISMAPKDKEQITEEGDYLAKMLMTVVTLVDKNTPTVVGLYDAILHIERVRH